MNREFLDLYNRELNLLYEQAREFAEEYPGIAERLGGLLEDRIDPMIGGLLEGAAFLAARVQLKLKHEFPEFTNNLLEQLVPHYLAPTPSALLVKALPVFGDAALRDGQTDCARLLSRRLLPPTRPPARLPLSACGDITLWPFDLDRRRIFRFAGAAAGAGRSGRQRCACRPEALADASHHGRAGG